MRASASTICQRAACLEARLYARQSLVVSVPSHTRLTVAEGRMRLAFLDASLSWLGESVPTVHVTLSEGESFLIERGCHLALSGVQAGTTVLHFKTDAVMPWLARLKAWALRYRPAVSTDTMPTRSP